MLTPLEYEDEHRKDIATLKRLAAKTQEIRERQQQLMCEVREAIDKSWQTLEHSRRLLKRAESMTQLQTVRPVKK